MPVRHIQLALLNLLLEQEFVDGPKHFQNGGVDNLGRTHRGQGALGDQIDLFFLAEVGASGILGDPDQLLLPFLAACPWRSGRRFAFPDDLGGQLLNLLHGDLLGVCLLHPNFRCAFVNTAGVCGGDRLSAHGLGGGIDDCVVCADALSLGIRQIFPGGKNQRSEFLVLHQAAEGLAVDFSAGQLPAGLIAEPQLAQGDAVLFAGRQAQQIIHRHIELLCGGDENIAVDGLDFSGSNTV